MLVFTKPAAPGKVKTRLIGELTAEQAAELHQAFLDDVTDRLDSTGHALWLAWALEEGERPPATRWRSVRQDGANLGERLYRALASAASEYERVAAVGSDHPEMPGERIDEAFALLDAGADVVLGPTSDGGYYLVAVRADSLEAGLFEAIPWSTEAVLATTLERAARLGLTVEMLPLGHDVDTAPDLARLTAHLEIHPDTCPRTRETLESWERAGAR